MAWHTNPRPDLV